MTVATYPAGLLGGFLAPGLIARPDHAADLPFLAELYRLTRWDELAASPFADDWKREFLQQQFQTQRRAYALGAAAPRFLVVEQDGEPVGRMVLDDQPGELRLVDIALHPAWQGRGLGTRLLRAVLREAWLRGLTTVLHVDPANPALRLYERLGFAAEGPAGADRLYMCRPPAEPCDGSAA